MVLRRTSLELTIDSDQELGVLDTGYVEDFYGVDGYLTLRHSSGIEFSIIMANVSGGGPSPNDHFMGTRDATVMPLGSYDIRGRVQSVAGQKTILTAFQTPDGLENTQTVLFNLIDRDLNIVIVKNISLSRARFKKVTVSHPTLKNVTLIS